jgi:membrane protein required for colicin V production
VISPLDGFFAGVSAWFLGRGLLRGLSGELGSLLGSFGGAWASFRFGPDLSPRLEKLLGVGPQAAGFIGILVVYLSVLLAAALLTRLIRGILSAVHLSLLDRLLGVGAGVLKVAILAILVYVLGSWASPFLPVGWADRSLSMRLAASAAPVVLERVLPRSGPSLPSLPVSIIPERIRP